MHDGTQADTPLDDAPDEGSSSATTEAEASETVLLRDLAPRGNVKGGSGKFRFGESKSLEPRDES